MKPARLRAFATVCLVVCLALVVYGLVLGFHIESTPRALDDAAKGQSIGVAAAAGALAAVVALVFARRGSALWFLVVALLLAALAILLSITM